MEKDWVCCEGGGYAVKEAAHDAQAALDAQNILSISFDWIKFKTYYKTPG